MTKSLEAQATKAVSGALMTLGRVFTKSSKDPKSLDIGSFSNELIKYSKGVGDFGKFQYYFVGEGDNAGGGRLAKGMAVSAVSYIKKAITTDRSLYKGPELQPLKDGFYSTWKHKVSKFRGRPVMYLTGATADAIGVLRYRQGGKAAGLTVGIRDNFFVSPLPMGGKGKVKVRDYALLHEIGMGGHPQRPIVTGSMAGWLALHFPKWGEAFSKMMYESFWVDLKERDKAEVPESYVDFGGSMRSTTEIAADIFQVAKYMENSSKSISSHAQKLVTMTATGSRGAVLSKKQTDLVKKTLRQELSGGGLSSSDVEEIINTALTGKIPDFKSYG